jgi:hypothetical protein
MLRLAWFDCNIVLSWTRCKCQHMRLHGMKVAHHKVHSLWSLPFTMFYNLSPAFIRPSATKAATS